VIHSFFKSISDFLRPKGSTDSQPQREKIKRLFVGVVMKTRSQGQLLELQLLEYRLLDSFYRNLDCST
jgi:hypothetical protein